jgi:hypothetical protein
MSCDCIVCVITARLEREREAELPAMTWEDYEALAAADTSSCGGQTLDPPCGGCGRCMRDMAFRWEPVRECYVNSNRRTTTQP